MSLPGDVYADDSTIPDGELLFRMIIESNTLFEDGVAVRPQTNAFQDRPERDLEELGVPAVAVSVYLESEMTANSTTPQDLVARWGPKYGVASITAGECRAEGQGVVRWPNAKEPDHAMIFALQGAKKSGGQSKRLARTAVIVIPPPEPSQ